MRLAALCKGLRRAARAVDSPGICTEAHEHAARSGMPKLHSHLERCAPSCVPGVRVRAPTGEEQLGHSSVVAFSSKVQRGPTLLVLKTHRRGCQL
mmetsp:Transcript_115507/g.258257  ORF Transcript_115507/g.258257 Transcript_115507/m.258257 type:complete len:95 (+) Transcript_115507:331-615(+)